MVAPTGGEEVVEDEEDRRGHEHHVAHGGGGGGPDVDAVVDERCETGEWQQVGPEHEPHRRADDILVLGEHPQQPLSAEHKQQREENRQRDAPPHQGADNLVQQLRVPRPHVLAHERLASVGEPVHDVRCKREKLHQQGVCGENLLTHIGGNVRDEGEHGNEAERTQEDIGVDLEEADHLAHVQCSPPADVGPEMAVAADPDENGEQQAAVLRHHGPPRHARDARIESIDEEQAEDDVHQVENRGYPHRGSGVLHPEEPAFQHVETDGGRSRPDADVEVGEHQAYGRRGTVQETFAEQCDRPLQQEEHRRRRPCNHQTLHQHVEVLLLVFRAVRLRREPSRACSQESEVPVNQVEDHRRQGDGRNVTRVADVSHNRHINHAEQRHRDVGHDAGDGNTENFAVHCVSIPQGFQR